MEQPTMSRHEVWWYHGRQDSEPCVTATVWKGEKNGRVGLPAFADSTRSRGPLMSIGPAVA